MINFIRMIFASAAAAILLAGCGMDNSNPLLGKWKAKYIEMGTTKMNAPVKTEEEFKSDKVITRADGAEKIYSVKKYTVTATKDGSKIVIYPKVGDGSLTAYVYDHGNKMKLQVGPAYEIYSRA